MNSYKEKWDRENTTQIKIKLNNHTDSDIIEWFQMLDNKQGTIKEMIRNSYGLNRENENKVALEKRIRDDDTSNDH